MADLQMQAVGELIGTAGLGNQGQSDQILQLVKGLFFQTDLDLLAEQKAGRFDTEYILKAIPLPSIFFRFPFFYAGQTGIPFHSMPDRPALFIV